MVLKQYIKEDWADGNLNQRMNQYSSAYSTSVGRTLKGFHRPDWTVESGSPSVTNGYLSLPAGDEVSVPTEFINGTWSFTFTFENAPSTSVLALGVLWVDSQTRYYIQVDGVDGNLNLQKRVNDNPSTVISSNWNPDTNSHDVRVHRDPDGSWYLGLDGVAKGGSNDVYLPNDKTYIYLFNATDVEVTIDSVNIY